MSAVSEARSKPGADLARDLPGVERRPFFIAAVAGGISLVLYLATLAPDIVGGDAGEFQFVPHVLGIAHHTGYPLYTLVGALWSLIPIGSIALRMNLLSAIFAAATVATVYLAAWEATRRREPALLASASLAVTELFWRWGTMAGVRSSTAWTAALVIYLAVRWQRETRTVPGDPVAARTFSLLALAYGVALAHHRSAALLGLPLLLFVVIVDGRIVLRRAVMVRAALLFLLPLLTYLYLPIRALMGSPFDQFHPDTLPRFLDLVVATGLSQSFLSVPPADMPARWAMLGGEIWREFGAIGVAVGFLGAGWHLWRRPSAFLLTALFTLSVVFQTLGWNVGPGRLNVVYLIPAYAVFALWIACGSDFLGNAVARAFGRLAWKGLAHSGVAAVLLLSFLQLGAANLEDMQRRAAGELDKFRQHLDAGFLARRLVAASLPYIEDNAVIYADWEQATPFWYVQQIEGLKPNVELAYGVDSVAEVEKRANGRPIYLARAVPDTGNKRLTAVGPLVKLLEGARTDTPANLKPLQYRLGSQIGLLGYVQYDEQGRSIDHFDGRAKVLAIELYWQAITTPQSDYSVSLRLVDDAGNLVAQLDNKHPVLSMYPTSRWAPGEIVGDYYELSLRGVPPKSYRLEVLMYTSSAQGWHNLDVFDAAGRPIGDRAVIVRIT